MSFGFSIGDAILLTQLASRVVQNSREACGAHDELTYELASLHLVLNRLKEEVAKVESAINRPDGSCQDELQSLVVGCQKVLKTLENILLKYNSLSLEERSVRKLWQRIRFGNGEMQNLTEIRAKLVYYTSAISLFLNMISVGSIGRVEQRMNETGGDLREIKLAINGITAHLLARKDREGSVLTTYADDDKTVWRQFRRELVAEGFSSSSIRKHKGVIKAYVKELADRGLLDEEGPCDGDSQDAFHTTKHRQGSLTIPSDTHTAGAAAKESPQSEEIYLDGKASLEVEKSAKEIDADLKTRVIRSALVDDRPIKVKDDTSWSRLQSNNDAVNREPPAWLLYDERNSYLNCGVDQKDFASYIFVAAPFGICLTTYTCAARGYNLSLIWWQFRWRIENIQKCLAAPLVSCALVGCENGHIVPPDIEHDLERLCDFENAVIRAIALSLSPVQVAVPVFPEDFHRSFLDKVIMGAGHGEDIFDILDRINAWILDYEVECSGILKRVRQWSNISKLDVKAANKCTQRIRTGIIFNPPRFVDPISGKLTECSTCLSDVPVLKFVKLAWTQAVCHNCLHRVFDLSISKRRHMGPKCSTISYLSLKTVDHLFPLDLQQKWNEKYKEYNPVHCSASDCGNWIRPANIHLNTSHTATSRHNHRQCSRYHNIFCMAQPQLHQLPPRRSSGGPLMMCRLPPPFSGMLSVFSTSSSRGSETKSTRNTPQKIASGQSDKSLSRDPTLASRPMKMVIAEYCRYIEAYVKRTRKTKKKFQESIMLESIDMQLKIWRRYFGLFIAPVCREFLDVLSSDERASCTLEVLREWIKGDYLVKLNSLDVGGDLDAERNKQEGLGEADEILSAIVEQMDPEIQLDRLERLLNSEFVPKCLHFASHPPSDAKARDAENKVLSGVILTQVLLKLDAVNVKGDERLEARRKKLIRETEDVLNGLDAVERRKRN